MTFASVAHGDDHGHGHGHGHGLFIGSVIPAPPVGAIHVGSILAVHTCST
jgi:hypothetical protein